jgi:Cu-Zn family superoxide dismutase
MKRINTVLFSLFVATALVFTSCAQQEQTEEMEAHTHEHEAAFDQAVVVLHPTEGNSASGTVTFTKVENGIRIEADVTGLGEGMHGFHIHEYGDCTAPDGTSAGGHFNPEGAPHAGPDDDPRHVGDLGNLEADADGNATYTRVDEHLSFSGDHSIIGRAVIVHAGEDDLESQPTGAAGPRVACGVIGIANQEM